MKRYQHDPGSFPVKEKEEIRNAFLTPSVKVNKTLTGSVYYENGKICRISQRQVSNANLRLNDPQFVNIDLSVPLLRGTSLYLGHFSNHYGHFLLETLARIWIIENNPEYDHLLFHPLPSIRPYPADEDFDKFPPFLTALKTWNIQKQNIRLINFPLRAERLIVPSSLIRLKANAHADQHFIYQKIVDFCKSQNPVQSAFKRVYVSRRQNSRMGRRIQNEQLIEELFAQYGFEIIHPQQIPFEHQVLIYNRVNIIAGFTGSALHNALFMKTGSQVISIGDMRVKRNPHPNQIVCCSLSKVSLNFVPFKGNAIDEKKKIADFDINYLRKKLHEILS